MTGMHGLRASRGDADRGWQPGRTYKGGDLNETLTRLEHAGPLTPRERGEAMALEFVVMTPDQRERLARLTNQAAGVAPMGQPYGPSMDTGAALAELEAVSQPTDYARGMLAAVGMRPGLLPSERQRVDALRAKFGQGLIS